MLSGVRGSRLPDRRPPHYRCPAVPGLETSARAILMARAPPFFLGDQLPTMRILRTAGSANYWWPRTAPLFGSQPRRPSCTCSGLEPHCRTPGARARSRRLRRGAAHLLHCWVLRTALTCTATAITAVLLTAAPDHCGHPVRSSVPSPSCDIPGFGTPPPHRPANYGYCWPAVRLCQALLSLCATRETIATPAPNVYSGRHRFSRVRQ
jgi:hypothetical protein